MAAHLLYHRIPMYQQEYEEMYRLEDFYWWFVGRRRLVSEILRNESASGRSLKILDVGCGTGANMLAFSPYGEVHGVDPSSQAVTFCERRSVSRVKQASVENLPYPDSFFDVVTILDVLEHTDDDLAALKEVKRVAKPDALIISTVPAYGFLWSEHDEALQHRRRYSAHEVRNKMTVCGFDVERSSYFVTLLFWPIFLVRIFQGLAKDSTSPKTGIHVLPPWLNSLLLRLLDIERWMLRGFNLPFGVTIVATARATKKQVEREQAGSKNGVKELAL
jgi:ubiquinone/menaquinone biosynthesis C-methylase UbiE